MKVSERISQIRGIINDSNVERTIGALKVYIMDEIVQLEVEIVEALQIARQEGFRSGRHISDLHEGE